MKMLNPFGQRPWWSLVFVVLGACASKPAATVREPRPPAQPVASSPVPAARAPDDAGPSNVAIARDIREACGIGDAEAFFAYDSARVRQEDHSVLRKLSDCFMTGPLKEREMRLVGHADPRGDEEYNYLLGQRRADSVKTAIASVGMSDARIATTSRGEDEARGSDEAGWTKDRRVDVVLGN